MWWVVAVVAVVVMFALCKASGDEDRRMTQLYWREQRGQTRPEGL